jgi:hypothetical protein
MVLGNTIFIDADIAHVRRSAARTGVPGEFSGFLAAGNDSLAMSGSRERVEAFIARGLDFVHQMFGQMAVSAAVGEIDHKADQEPNE